MFIAALGDMGWTSISTSAGCGIFPVALGGRGWTSVFTSESGGMFPAVLLISVTRHVARIFDGGGGGLLASEAKLRQGFVGAAPLGRGLGAQPPAGSRGRAPRKFLRNMASYTSFGNKDRVLNLLLT